MLIDLLGMDTRKEGADAGRCADYIREVLSEGDIKTYSFVHEGRPRTAHHVAAVLPGLSPYSVLLHAHMDTAGYSPEDGWIVPPEEATLIRGRIFGRGAMDCKGQLSVWLSLMRDMGKRAVSDGPLPFTLKMFVTDLEETEGERGLGSLISSTPHILDGVRLVIGEGGGYPVPFRGRNYYTFQTEERDVPFSGASCTYTDEEAERILSMGIEKGYLSGTVIPYRRETLGFTGRKLDTAPLYEGMEGFYEKKAESIVYRRFGPVFLRALRKADPSAALMPTVTPGKSDNRLFRERGIPTAGFFPLIPSDSPSGIHGANEYISTASLDMAYSVIKDAVTGLMDEPGIMDAV